MGAAPPDPDVPPLRRRRDELALQVSEEQWDLGGLAYEMAIRDHFRLDILVRRAAQLQERDAELAEIERLLRLEDSASVGSCPACSAPHSRGALFCWQCGATLMERAPSTAVPAVAQNAVAQDAVAQNAVAQDAVAQDAVAQDAVAQDAVAQQNAVAAQDTLVQQVGEVQAGPASGHEHQRTRIAKRDAPTDGDARDEHDTLIMNPLAAEQ